MSLSGDWGLGAFYCRPRKAVVARSVFKLHPDGTMNTLEDTVGSPEIRLGDHFEMPAYFRGRFGEECETTLKPVERSAFTAQGIQKM